MMENNTAKAMIVALLAGTSWLGCMMEESGDPGTLIQRQAISDCGGFAEAEPEDDGADEYCTAERLNWTYDANTETLELVDARALLNCCGNRSVALSVVDGVHVVTETDAPDDVGGRCFCMCVFDLELTVEGLPEGAIPVRLQRHQTDAADAADATQVIWEGELDLGAGAGSLVLDETTAEGWCEGSAG